MAVRLLLSVAVCACVASWAESFGISTGHWHKNPPCRKSCCDAPKVTDDWGNCAKYKANEWCKTDGSPGPAWDKTWGNISASVMKGCCACGGGVSSKAPTARPTRNTNGVCWSKQCGCPKANGTFKKRWCSKKHMQKNVHDEATCIRNTQEWCPNGVNGKPLPGGKGGKGGTPTKPATGGKGGKGGKPHGKGAKKTKRPTVASTTAASPTGGPTVAASPTGGPTMAAPAAAGSGSWASNGAAAAGLGTPTGSR